jgi:hypothetical protein
LDKHIRRLDIDLQKFQAELDRRAQYGAVNEEVGVGQSNFSLFFFFFVASEWFH